MKMFLYYVMMLKKVIVGVDGIDGDVWIWEWDVFDIEKVNLWSLLLKYNYLEFKKVDY